MPPHCLGAAVNGRIPDPQTSRLMVPCVHLTCCHFIEAALRWKVDLDANGVKIDVEWERAGHWVCCGSAPVTTFQLHGR